MTVGVLLAACPVALTAKKKPPPTKTIQGKVLDSASNPVPGAAVELTNVTKGKTLAIYSDADGRYQFTDLDPHDDYQVQATFKGKHSEIRRASSLDDRNPFVLNLVIPGLASP